MLISQEHLGIELSVLHRDAGLIGERHQEIEILGVERIAGELGSHHDGADDGGFGDEGEDEGPVELRERVVESFAAPAQPITPDFIGEEEIPRTCQRGNDLIGRLVRRIERALSVALFGNRSSESWA